MNKIIVIGCPGSGKSVFSIKLNKLTDISLYHLDMINWNEDRIFVDKSVFIERINNVINKDKWIIDGNYASTIEIRLRKCDTVFFLDYSLDVCINGIKERIGKKRPDMPWIETELDDEFLDFVKNFVKNFGKNTRPKIISLLEKYSYKDIYIYIFLKQEKKQISI